MKNWKERLEKLDSAEISDALDSLGIEGALLNIKPIKSGIKCIGKAFTVKYVHYEEKPEKFQGAGDYIDEVEEGSVIVIDNNGRENCTVWGDILTRYALSRQIAGTIIHGAVRDVSQICSLGYPLFSKAVFMRSGKNRVQKIANQIEIIVSGISISPNDIIFGDDNGVLVIPKAHLEEVIMYAENIKQTEERIIKAILSGESLQNARKKYRYDQPWLNVDEKKC